MTSKLKTDILETVSGSGTIALTNQLSGMTSASVPSGSVIQVNNIVIDTVTTTAQTSFVAAGDTDITFSSLASTSSKVLVKYNLYACSTKGSNIIMRLYRSINGASFAEVTGPTSSRGSGNINTWLSNGYNPISSHQDYNLDMFSGEYLDSPNTTSSVTYKIYFASRDTNACYINRSTTFNANDSASPCATSSATIMEIKG